MTFNARLFAYLIVHGAQTLFLKNENNFKKKSDKTYYFWTQVTVNSADLVLPVIECASIAEKTDAVVLLNANVATKKWHMIP